MPKFTLIKHPDNDFDCNVTVTFDTDVLDAAQGHFNDFLRASGFEMSLDEPSHAEKIDSLLEEAEEAMWSDAFNSKFRNDGPVGEAGHDIIKFPSRY